MSPRLAKASLFSEVFFITKNERTKNLEIYVAFEESLELYIKDCRKQIHKFVEFHFSLKQTIALQKQTFIADLFVNPLNALWSIPYVVLKKIVEILEKLGWNSAIPLFQLIPNGIKTGYQRKIEYLVAKEILEFNLRSQTTQNNLLNKLKWHPELSKFPGLIDEVEILIIKEFKETLNRYSSSRSLLSDLAATFFTLLVGWISFGDQSLGWVGLGNRLAHVFARDKAASSFFLGKKVGSSFYRLFPPEPSFNQIVVATVLILLLLTIVSLIATVLGDVIIKKLGLQEKKLEALLQDLEITLLMKFKRHLKRYKN